MGNYFNLDPLLVTHALLPITYYPSPIAYYHFSSPTTFTPVEAIHDYFRILFSMLGGFLSYRASSGSCQAFLKACQENCCSRYILILVFLITVYQSNIFSTIECF